MSEANMTPPDENISQKTPPKNEAGQTLSLIADSNRKMIENHEENMREILQNMKVMTNDLSLKMTDVADKMTDLVDNVKGMVDNVKGMVDNVKDMANAISINMTDIASSVRILAQQNQGKPENPIFQYPIYHNAVPQSVYHNAVPQSYESLPRRYVFQPYHHSQGVYRYY